MSPLAALPLDRNTIHLVGAIVFVLTLLVMITVWRVNRAQAGVAWWLASSVMAIPGLAATPICRVMGWPVSYGIGFNNGVSLSMHLLALEGALRYRGCYAPARWYWRLAAFPAFFAFGMTHREDAVARYLGHDLIAAALLGALAFTMRRRVTENERSVHSLAALFPALLALAFAGRWCIALTARESDDLAHHPYQMVLALAGIVFTNGWTFGVSLCCYERAQEQLRALALCDALTGLPNRRCFEDTLARELRRAERSGVPFAVLVMDLNGFKRVNDTMGHDAGDALLVEAARRLRATTRESDFVARLGGDEFVAIAVDVSSRDQLDRVRQRIRGAVDGACEVSGHTLGLSVSVGGAIWTTGRGAAELMREADARMYDDKRSRPSRRPQALVVATA
jgi:diguanylate cyclase (GGDEF)-like protein